MKPIPPIALSVLFAFAAGVAPVIAASDVAVKVAAVSESRAKQIIEEDSKGEIRPPTQLTSLRVTLELSGEPVVGATQYGGLSYKATDDKGNELKAQEGLFGPQGKDFIALDRALMWLGREKPPADRIRIDLEMDASKREATKIASLKGSVKLLTGKPVELLIGDPAKTVDKPLPNRELADAGLKVIVTQFNPSGGVVGSYAKVKVSGKLAAMSRIDVVDAAGKSLSQGAGVSHGFGGSPSTYEVFGDNPLPAGAKLKVVLLADVKEIEVPFDLKDVPLP